MDMIVPFSLAWLKAALPLDSAGLERALESPFFDFDLSELHHSEHRRLLPDLFCGLSKLAGRSSSEKLNN